MSFKLSSTIKRDIERDLEPKMQAGAESDAAVLKANVSGQGRSGRHHSGLPFRSSAPGEYPTEQQGDLAASVDANPTNDPLSWQVGFFGEPQGKLNNLEYAPPALGGRQPLARTREDPETIRRRHEAMK